MLTSYTIMNTWRVFYKQKDNTCNERNGMPSLLVKNYNDDIH